MALLSRAFSAAAPTLTRDLSPDRWFSTDLFATDTGLVVDPASVLRCATVLAALRVRADAYASLPLITYQRMGDAGKRRARTHPAYRALHTKPNPWQTSFRWRHQQRLHTDLWGNSYSRMKADPQLQFWPLEPWATQPIEQNADGTLTYRYTSPSKGTPERIHQQQILHVSNLSIDGYEGENMMQLMRNAVAVALAAEKHGAVFLKKGARLSGILSSKGTTTQDQRDELRASWSVDNAGLSNVGSVAVLPDGLEFTPLAIDNQKTQLLELQDFQVGQLLRFLGVPGVLVGYSDKTSTYASAEQFFLSFVKHTILPMTVNTEQELNCGIFDEDEEFFCEFLLEGLLRGDILTRFRAHQIAILTGWKNRNEVRVEENHNPGPEELDEFLEPQNMRVADAGSGSDSTPAQSTGRGGTKMDAELSALAGRAKSFAVDAASRVIRRELWMIRGGNGRMGAALRFAKNPAGWREWVETFYGEHAEHVSDTLKVPIEDARTYCAEQRQALLEGGVAAVDEWEETNVPRLAALALGEK